MNRVCKKIIHTATLLALVVAFAVPISFGSRNPKKTVASWAQWRGPQSQGVSAEKGLPSEWSESKNILWKTPIAGRGHSSPIVWGDRVFLTTAVEGSVVPGAKAPVHYDSGEVFKHPDSVGAEKSQTVKVLCVSAVNGKPLWDKTVYEGPMYDDRHRKGSYASATPVTDGQHVYFYFGTEGAFCFDFNGKQVWKTDLGKIATQGMGVASSPILHQNLLIIQVDEEWGERSFMLALDKRTGKQVWKTPRKSMANWTTPVIADAGNRLELIASGHESVVSYDPATGKELWHASGLDGYVVPTPLVGHGLGIFCVGYPKKRAVAIKLGGSGNVANTTQIAWTYEKGVAYVPSPIMVGDYVYIISDRGIMTCLEAKTGKVIYEGARVPVPASFTASPVAFEDKILLTSEDGYTFVLKAGTKPEVIRTNSLGEPIFASPALAGGKIYIRALNHLYCIGSKS